MKPNHPNGEPTAEDLAAGESKQCKGSSRGAPLSESAWLSLPYTQMPESDFPSDLLRLLLAVLNHRSAFFEIGRSLLPLKNLQRMRQRAGELAGVSLRSPNNQVY